jgi:CheY-like chemotaxis protein
MVTFSRPLRHTPAAMPYTILVIDDDAEIRAMVSELLASRYERVVAAPSGEDGLVVARAVHAD